MRYVCLWSPSWSTGEGPAPELAAAFLEVVPRVVVEGRGVVWADARGLPGRQVAEALLALATVIVPDDEVRAGLAAVPVVAEVAARWARGTDSSVSGTLAGSASVADESADDVRGGDARTPHRPAVFPVQPGQERKFLAPFPLALLVSAMPRSGAPSRAGATGRGRRAARSEVPHRISAHTRGQRDAQARGTVVSGSGERLLALLDGVGLRSCGELAALDPAAVEVRFGAEGVHLWRLARGDDSRYLFSPIPPERPHASLDFIDYLVTDPERLVFTVNALLESVLARLRGRGEHARRLLLTLSLANGELWHRSLRPARPTASRELWLRLVRGILERVTIPDAVAGVALEVEALEPAAVRQGDLFDQGFATAGAVEAALARLLEREEGVIVEPRHSGHPLPERRVIWDAVDPFQQDGAQPGRGRGTRSGGKRAGASMAGVNVAGVNVAGGSVAGVGQVGVGQVGVGQVGVGQAGGKRVSGKRVDGKRVGGKQTSASAPTIGVTVPAAGASAEGARLSLHLLPEPQPIDVETEGDPAHSAPLRYHDRTGWHRLATAAGPDRISGGQWEEAYAREYFRCITEEGALVWLFRDARRGTWFLHGWWG